MINRRNVLLSSAAIPAVVVGGMTGQLATCSSTGIVINPAVLNAIQQAVATACNFIPAVTTIAALIAATFPAVAGAATITSTVLSQISAILCAAVPSPSPVAGGKFKANTLAGTSIPANGWIVQDGKLVYV